MARLSFASAMRQFMEKFDLLLTPAVAVPAFEVEKISPWPDDAAGRSESGGHSDISEWLSWTPFSIPFNLTQQPAASIPCGFTRAGLPVGLQIAGRMYDDAGVLAAASAYQSADPHFGTVPKGFA
jgi:aspartyl-tRNA(Asn)/glutamyl-tRNA(Gln) amidotransferase subunit A